MADLKLGFPKEEYDSLVNNRISIVDFLSRVLPIRTADVSDPGNKLTELLLSYHSDDGGAVIITRIELEHVAYDDQKKAGKINFKYFLTYHYACSYSEKEYKKNDKVDFVLDAVATTIKLTFLDLDTRSTSDEF